MCGISGLQDANFGNLSDEKKNVLLWLLLRGVLFRVIIVVLHRHAAVFSEPRRRASLTPSRPMLSGSCLFGVFGELLHLSGMRRWQSASQNVS